MSTDTPLLSRSPTIRRSTTRRCCTRSPPDRFYIGALGSRKTHARRLERLKQEGVSDADLTRIHAPVGLDIGAVSPAEIAVAIMAQITERLRQEPDQQPDQQPEAKRPLVKAAS